MDPAPRIAYEIGAEAADGNDAGVARLWSPLDGPARARVLSALGSQARCTAHAVGCDPAGLTLDLLADQALHLLFDLCDCEFRGTALSALAGLPLGPLPACDGCPRPAVALATARARPLQRAGFRPQDVAELSRRAARR